MLLCLCSAPLMFAGCGGGKAYDGPKRVPVTGTVTFKGQPVSGGMLSLIPENGELGASGGEIIDGQINIPEEKGPNLGTYRVAVYWHQPTGEKKKDPDTGEEIDVVKQVIPQEYNGATKLSATFTGEAESDKLDINIE